MKKLFYLLVGILLLLACNPENNTKEELPVAIYAPDFLRTIEENPNPGQIIGFVEGSTNIGTVTFAIFEESVEGAFEIDANNGKLKVADPLGFDFEARQQITAIVAVSNADLTEYTNITVEILDVFIENERRLNNIEFVTQNANSGPLFTDTDNSFIFSSNNFNRWDTNYTNVQYTDAIVNTGPRITEYTSFVITNGVASNSYYTFQYNANDLVEHIEFIYELPDVPSSVTYNFTMSYDGLTGTLVDDASGDIVTISFDPERFIRRIESPSKSLQYEFDNDNNLTSKTDQDGNVVSYQYDVKRNPFPDLAPFNFAEIRALLAAIRFEYRNDQLSSSRNNGIWQSLNNIVAVDATTCSGTCIENATYTFEYNADGYPSRKRLDGTNNVLDYFYE